MRLEIPDPPFTRPALEDVFGFTVPQPCVDALNILCQDCATAKGAYSLIDERLGWLLAGEDQRYSSTPTEVFPVAGTGMDGGHFGYVIHAPELEESDYPLARYEPMDSDPVRRIGRTTTEAISNILSFHLFPDWRPKAEWPSLPTEMLSCLAAVGIVPDEVRSGQRAEHGQCQGVPPVTVPPGWLHIPSSDGIGVLAPSRAFDTKCEHHVIQRPITVESIARAEAALAEGYPATALWHAREGLWHECHQPSDENFALSKTAAAAYRTLSRPQLARVVQRRVLRDFKGRSGSFDL